MATKKPSAKQIKKQTPLPPQKPKGMFGLPRRTIAERKVHRKVYGPLPVLRWLALLPLGLVTYACTFLFRGYSFTGLVSAVLMGILLFYNMMALLKNRYPKGTRVLRRLFTTLLVLGLVVVGATECLILKASFGHSKPECDYLVVLGAYVRPDGPSAALSERIHAAYDYLTAHPDTVAVVTGGQGADEPMTEAACMYNHLIAMGIDPNRILIEDKATSTWENLHFSLDLIEEATGVRPDKIGLISSEYHLFRASLFADACNVESVTIPAHTARLSQRINHFMREVAGVWHYIILGGQYRD